MRVRVDPVKCQGYAVCVELAGKHFEFDDWGFVQAVAVDVSDADKKMVDRAITECPIKAIRWLEPTVPAQNAEVNDVAELDGFEALVPQEKIR